MLGLFFNPADEGDTFLWNVGDFYRTTGIITLKIIISLINAFEMIAIKEVTGYYYRLKKANKMVVLGICFLIVLYEVKSLCAIESETGRKR